MRIIFHIDMDSYFATVEQQTNPFLRGKPIVVSGKENSRSVIVAASKEAKRFGVKTGQLHFQAKKLCPNLIFVFPDGDKYEFITRKTIEIFQSFTDRVEVFSIDEAFLDLTGFVGDFESAARQARQIKKILRQSIGDWITCSIGIAGNKLLAKLASEMDKPDGLFIIDEKNKENILEKVKLDDFCGIGSKILKRLENLGVQTINKLRQYPLPALIKEFGPSYAKFLRDLSWGIDNRLVVADYETAKIKSVSRSYTLPYDTADKKELGQVLLLLCEKCGRALRQKKLAAKTLEYFFRYDDFTHGGFRVTLSGYINDGASLYSRGWSFVSRCRLPKAVRKIGLRASNLVENYQQLPLWQKDRRRFKLIPYLDEINDKYGELTIKPGFLLDAQKLKRKVGGFRLDAK